MLTRISLFLLALAPVACSSSEPTATSTQKADGSAPIVAQPADTASSDQIQVAGTMWSLDDVMPFDPSIIVDTLENGLRIYVRKNAKPENRAALRLVLNAGSLMEDDDQLGLAHFAEHMLFNGTENFQKHEIINYMERHGMQFGADLNAYTSFDETVYMLQVPTDTIDILNQGIQILRDWSDRATFDGAEIDKERGVVTEEWRLGRGASARMLDVQLPVLLAGSRYADRLPIGDPDIINGADHETLRRFYRDWYRSDLMAVVAVGDFDAEAVADYIRSTFGDLKKPDAPRPRLEGKVPHHAETLIASATDSEAPYGSVSIIFKSDRQIEGTLRSYRSDVVSGLYHGMFNGRLGELTQSTDPPFAFAGSGAGSFVRAAEFYNLQAIVREGGSERALYALVTEAERVRRHGFTHTELDRAKETLRRAYERAYLERDKSESSRFAAEYGRNFLEMEPVPGIAFEYEFIEAILPGITLEEVNALSERLMTEGSRVVLLDGPDDPESPLPGEAAVLAIINDVGALELDAYVDLTLDAPLLSTPPVGGTIESESFDDSLGVTRLALSNGVQVVLKPTDFKNDQVLMSATSVGGTSLYPDSLFTYAVTASTLIGQSGLGAFGPIELGKTLSGKVVGVSASIGELTEGFSGSASPTDLETMFQLIYLNFSAARADSVAFESYKVRMSELLESAKASPERAYRDTILVTMSQGHYRSRPFGPSDLEEMDLSKSLAIFQDRFADASDFTFYFVGAFDLDSIKALAAFYLGSLPSLGREETWKDVGRRPPTGVISKEVIRGIAPKSKVQLAFTGPFEWSRPNRQVVNALVEVMKMKFREVLREDMGGTYGTSIRGSTSRRPYESYRISISFGCDPDRVDELVSQVMTQIDSLQTFGIPESYLQKIRETDRRNHEERLKQNGFWLRSLRFVDSNNQNPLTILTGSANFMESLSSDTIRAAAQTYLNQDNYAKFVLRPESESVSDGE